MAEEEQQEDQEEPKKRSKKPLLIGFVLAILLGAGGFYAVWSGMILAPKDATAPEHAQAESTPEDPLPQAAFVPLDPLVVNVGSGASERHLRFQAQLEVTPGSEEAVRKLLPRVVDVLNGYLRAIEPSELERKSALVRLRAQMLRRIQLVIGEGHVSDLLIMEFVLN